MYAIEKDPQTLDCARTNAAIYGVQDKITWFLGDCFELLAPDEISTQHTVKPLKQIIGDYGVVFASPPWGGRYFSYYEGALH